MNTIHLQTNVAHRKNALNQPIVLSSRKQKSRKRRYSKDLKELQQAEQHLTRANYRMARAIEKGLGSYRKRSAKSARKKRDGAVRDFMPKSGLAMSRAMGAASSIPYDFARAVSTKRAQKRLKQQLRVVSRSLR